LLVSTIPFRLIHFTVTPTTHISPPSLHDALPICCIHTHPIKRDKDIRNALHAGVRVFVADNPDEVRKFRPFRDQAELLLRVSFRDRKSTRLNSSHVKISYAVFCLKKKKSFVLMSR